MEKKFKDVEQKFSQLKRDFRLSRITRQEFIERLKKLRLKDQQGRFWMIGTKSGKWYYYDGKSWIQSHPPSIEEGKAICIYCGYENNLEEEVCGGCGQSLGNKQAYCPSCGHRLEEPSLDCPYCGEKGDPLENQKGNSETQKKVNYFIFRSINPISLFLFLGVAGIFFGILGGSLLGATDLLGRIALSGPLFLQELQGTLIGGIVYAVIGGMIGFLLLGLSGFILALFVNFISSFVGGVKIRLD